MMPEAVCENDRILDRHAGALAEGGGGRMGVPTEHAFGEDPYSCPERLCAVYLPSTWMLGLLLST